MHEGAAKKFSSFFFADTSGVIWQVFRENIKQLAATVEGKKVWI
jgi:hypothetical protein